MTNDNFKMLCTELETLASEIFDDETAPCRFEDDNVVEFEQEFNLWSDR